MKLLRLTATFGCLDHATLEFGPGLTLIEAPNGGGKSTLAALIARFFDPQSGSISIGGVNVKDIDKNKLMDTVSFVQNDLETIIGMQNDFFCPIDIFFTVCHNL